MKQFYSDLDDFQKEYDSGTITISEDIEWSMKRTVKQITHYIMSRYLDGGADNTDPVTKLRRGFRNIGNFIVDLEWRAKNIDRKSIEAHATDGDHIFSLIVNKELQQWMKNNNFGKTIDDYQRKKSEYGSALLKKTETSDELLIEPVQWSNVVVDPCDIGGGPKIEKHNLSLLTLKKKSDVWTETIDGGIDAVIAAARKKKERRVEVLDVEGEFEHCVIYPDEEEREEGRDETIALYNIILAQVGNKKFCLYREKLKEGRFKHDARKAVEGRDMGMGVWEEVFEPQIATNEAVIAEKEAVDLGGKVVIKTNKKGLRDGMSLVNGELIDLEEGEFFDPVSLAPQTLPVYQNVIDAWFQNMQRDQSAFPGMTGEEPKASTPGISLELQAAQGASIFNKRRDQDGYFLLDEVVIDWALPFIVKRINKDHVLTASYSAAELQKLDEAIADYRMKQKALDGFLVTPEMKEAEKEKLRTEADTRTLFIPKGYITMERIKQKVRFDITDEMKDDQRQLNAVASTLGQLDPADPQRGALIAEMMEIMGISAASFPVAAPAAQAAIPKQNANRVQDVLPEGQRV